MIPGLLPEDAIYQMTAVIFKKIAVVAHNWDQLAAWICHELAGQGSGEC
jgi:hypothetical protein